MSQDKMHAPISPELTVNEDLQLWITRSKTRLLCNTVINTEIRVLRFLFSKIHVGFLKVDDTLVSTSIAMIFLAVILYALTIIIGKFGNPSISVWNPAALFVSLLSAFSLSLVKRLHDTILCHGGNNIAQQIILASPCEGKALEPLRDWWRSLLSRRRQVSFVLFVGIFGVTMLAFIGSYAQMEIHAGSYFLIFVCGVAIGQGGYCAIVIPTLAKVLRQMPMSMFWLYPADTPWVRKLSSIFTKLSIANALIGTFIMFGLLWLKPWKSMRTAGFAGMGLVFTWTVVLYSFIYPHFQLGKALKAEKTDRMLDLQGAIESQRKALLEENPSEDGIKKLNEMIKVYEQLASARASAIDTQAILRLFLSLGIPTLSFIAVLIELGRRLSDFMKDPSVRN
jgi:hypothetical protein